MFPKHVKLLLIFLVTCVVELSNGQRSQVGGGTNLRGHSFGLENFLFQRYEDAEANNAVRVVTPKRGRPTGRPTPVDRGQTYGLENLRAGVYESSRIKPYPERKKQVEPVAESSRVKEIVLPMKEPEPPREIVTERIRKRIMMKRRRKRPSNVDEVNAILKPERIPIFPQVSKVVIRTKLPEVTQEETTQLTTEIERITTTTTTTTEQTTTTTTEPPSTIDLKTFLKQQTKTLSLSELLQTQNLSLADLIKGNKDASVILKATTTTSTTPRKTFNKLENPEPERVEVTTSRPNYNRFQPKIPRIKPPEQLVSKPETEPNRPNVADPLNRLNEMRLKLRNFQRKTTEPKEETTKPITRVTETPVSKRTRVSFKSTNNPELSVILPTKPETLKRPEKLTNWTNRLPPRFDRIKDELKVPFDEVVASSEQPEEELKTTNRFPSRFDGIKDEVKPLKVPLEEMGTSSEQPEEEPKTTPIPLVEDVRKPEPKDELIELLKSEQNAGRLQKILNSRNMTIQELLDNREKPPLQMDITTLFSSHLLRERSSPAPTLFESLPDFDSKPAEVYDEPYAEESAPTIARVELVPPNREPKRFQDTSDLRLDDLKADTSNAEHPALWKLSEKSIYYGNSYGIGEVFTAEPETEKPNPPELTDGDVILLETLRRSQETNRKFKLDFSDFVKEEELPEAEDIEKSYIPPAVKSAIIASGVVMGIALFVFIAIFAACGWKQRRIRFKGSSMTDSLSKPSGKSKRTTGSYSGKSYKKTIDFDETSESGTSNTSSYLWSTLKNTFTSRTSTLKSREEKMKDDKMTLRRNESRRRMEDEDDEDDRRFSVKKIDRDRNVINTSFNFKRASSSCNINRFNECVHGY